MEVLTQMRYLYAIKSKTKLNDMKISEIKKKIIDANLLVGEKIYDCRFDQMYQIVERKKHNFICLYEKKGVVVEAVSFIKYHIEKGQHIVKQ